MANKNNHTRYFYANKSKIQDNINSGVINEWDIIICEDTKEQILITDELEQVVIKSRVYRFESIDSAEEFLNNQTDTYEGQIVSILSEKNGYTAYIVNKNSLGKFIVKPISVYDSSNLNYSELGERPIDNLQGDIENPVILNGQLENIYKVNGAYKLSETYPTIFQSSNSNLYLISYDENNNCLIRIISTTNITDYTVAPDGEILSKSEVPTSEWLEEQNYVTEDVVDSKLAALDVMTKDEAQSYVKNLIDDYVDDYLDEKLDEKIEEKVVSEDSNDIIAMFANN
jgi:hypothetical protein